MEQLEKHLHDIAVHLATKYAPDKIHIRIEVPQRLFDQLSNELSPSRYYVLPVGARMDWLEMYLPNGMATIVGVPNKKPEPPKPVEPQFIGGCI